MASKKNNTPEITIDADTATEHNKFEDAALELAADVLADQPKLSSDVKLGQANPGRGGSYRLVDGVKIKVQN